MDISIFQHRFSARSSESSLDFFFFVFFSISFPTLASSLPRSVIFIDLMILPRGVILQLGGHMHSLLPWATCPMHVRRVVLPFVRSTILLLDALCFLIFCSYPVQSKMHTFNRNERKKKYDIALAVRENLVSPMRPSKLLRSADSGWYLGFIACKLARRRISKPPWILNSV